MECPTAVLISDIHFNINTLELADKALRQAITKANLYQVPLIIAGDTHDTKANIRGECLNAIQESLDLLRTECFILRGNHDSLNEKSKESSLNCLARDFAFNSNTNEETPSRTIVNKPWFFNQLGSINGNSIHLIPYHSDVSELRKYLKRVDKNSCVIMHQGLQGSIMGDYIQDKSAITKGDVAGLRVIGGHYHQRQTIDLPNGGKWDYIGNPYSLSWGEAKDLSKGFQVLYSDGSLEFQPTNLRRHIIIEMNAQGHYLKPNTLIQGRDDLIWVKVADTKENLRYISKSTVSLMIDRQDFKYTTHATDTTSQAKTYSTQPSVEVLDSVIDGLTETTEECKVRLKKLWRDL